MYSVFPRKKMSRKVSIKKRFVSHLKRGVWVLIGCWFLQLQNCKQLNALIFSLLKQTLNRALWNYSRNTERAQSVQGVCMWWKVHCSGPRRLLFFLQPDTSQSNICWPGLELVKNSGLKELEQQKLLFSAQLHLSKDRTVL